MGRLGLMWAAPAALAVLAALAVASAYGDAPPELYGGDDDGSPGRDHDTGPAGCTVWADHAYDWTPLDPPRNNSPPEKSLYPGDVVRGLFTHGSEGCCRVRISGPAAVGDWSELTGVSGGSYTQHMAILPDRPTPDSSARGSYIRTAEYDDAGRSRTHWLGAVEGHGLVAGAKYTVSGYTFDVLSDSCSNLDARVTLAADFRYRAPFWETSIHEHHILDTRGYPASNLDYSQYPHDSIPLEAGSNLVLGAYRWETITITHEILSGGTAAEDFHCISKTCRVDLPAAPDTASYVGHSRYQGDARNPPWHGPDPGTKGRLDSGEAIFAIPATTSGEIRIVSTMRNDGAVVARGYNSTYQFVPSYDPALGVTAVSNTALGGDSALDRPVSAIIRYNGTISDTLHYCSVGTIHDTDGTVIPYGSTGSVDAWGRVAGDRCPERAAEWGDPGACGTPGCSYVAHPEPPAAAGWGRWSALNPETRALLVGFAGEHVICPTGPDAGECMSYGTPYLNWDFVPGTDRDFIPMCVMDGIAAEGGAHTNSPKPENWGLDGEWWPDGPYDIGEGAGPHSYRGVFSAFPGSAPAHYVVDTMSCEAGLGDRECVPRGSECRPEYDRRCEDVFTPYVYPDDYIISHHGRLQDMVVRWCGDAPTDRCAAEAYRVIDEVMAAMCSELFAVEYDGHNQVIDAGTIWEDGSGYGPNLCHNALAAGLYEPSLDGSMVRDWRECYGVEPGDGEGVWPDGRPDADPGEICNAIWGGGRLSEPFWDMSYQNVYVPYTPTTGAFLGIVERPGNMLLDDGSLTCSCDDMDGDGICDYAGSGPDLNGNGISDDWDTLTTDGAILCLDRTGTAAAAAISCWAKYGRDAAMNDSAGGLEYCLAEAGRVADGPDGECDPAVIIGRIAADGSVDTASLEDPAGLGRSLAEFTADPDLARTLAIPFQAVGGIIPTPYIVDGKHIYCDESEPWCITSGDTYPEHEMRRVCQDPEGPASAKRIPSPATMPPLYKPIFDERWPPECLPPYPVAEWSRPDHPVSLDLEGLRAEWPTVRPGAGHARTPSHVGLGGPEWPSTMLLHAGTGVVRFGPCDGCAAPPSAAGSWNGTIISYLGGAAVDHSAAMRHPPGAVSQQGWARVAAVEPCDDCPDGWRVGAGPVGVELVLTAYPEMRTPVAEPGEMAAHACQVDGDGGAGPLNIGGPAGLFSWPGEGAPRRMDYWNGMSCRDVAGVSITIQDYEAARHGPAAKRESGQPWTVAEGTDDVSVEIFRNGIWLYTLAILEHRGQCTSYAWSAAVTPGHTACPATAGLVADCLRDEGDVQGCLERHSGGPCSGVYAEDGIHKKWEFTAAERHGMIGPGGEVSGCGPGGCGGVETILRMPDGSYARPAGNGAAVVEAAGLAWDDAGGNILLRCEAGVGEDGGLAGAERGIPADDIDFGRGGSFACEAVQACERAVTRYKCLGGEVVEHVVCEEPADSYSILDMPYQEVLGSVGPQALHIRAVCPPDHPHAGPDSPGCDGRPIYDTHVLGEAADGALIYVDYFGVGNLAAGRDDPSSRMIHLRPPETFGTVHSITVEWEDGGHSRMTPAAPCTACTIEHAGGAEITIHNRYGATLAAVLAAAEPPRPSVIQADEITGAAWLYLPALVAGAAVYAVVRKYKSALGQ